MFTWGINDPPPPVVPSVMGTQNLLASVSVIGTWGVSRAAEQAADEVISVQRYLFSYGL